MSMFYTENVLDIGNYKKSVKFSMKLKNGSLKRLCTSYRKQECSIWEFQILYLNLHLKS